MNPPPALVAFEQALAGEAAAERKAAREAARLEPIVITIADQAELQRLYELARRNHRDTPVAMVRRHLRAWGREQLDAIRTEHRIA